MTLKFLYTLLSRNCKNARIDIILDNSGLEFFGDLCLAELLLVKRGVSKVVFHGKVCVTITSLQSL